MLGQSDSQNVTISIYVNETHILNMLQLIKILDGIDISYIEKMSEYYIPYYLNGGGNIQVNVPINTYLKLESLHTLNNQ